jgi:nuclear receptor co-repressor 1
LQHPKNFGVIKSYLERKCVSDCVQYYYLSKKAQNYRQLLRKSRARGTRSRTQNNANNSQVLSGSISNVKNETNGVTTRQQKEQKSDLQGGASSASTVPCASNQGSSGAANDNSSHTPPTSTSTTTAVASIKSEELPSTSQANVSRYEHFLT